MKKMIALSLVGVLLLGVLLLSSCAGAPARSLSASRTPASSTPASNVKDAPNTVVQADSGLIVQFLYEDFADIASANQSAAKQSASTTVEGNALYYCLVAGDTSTLHKKDLATGEDSLLYQSTTIPFVEFLLLDDNTALLFSPSENEDPWIAMNTFEVDILDLASSSTTPFAQQYGLDEYSIADVLYTDGVYYVMQQKDSVGSYFLSMIDATGTVHIIAADGVAGDFAAAGGNVYFWEYTPATGTAKTLYTAGEKNLAPVELMQTNFSVHGFSILGTQCAINYINQNSNSACVGIDMVEKKVVLDFSPANRDTFESLYLTGDGYFRLVYVAGEEQGGSVPLLADQLKQYDLAGNLVQAFTFEKDGKTVVANSPTVYGHTLYYLLAEKGYWALAAVDAA